MNKDEACNYRDQGYIELMPPPTTNNKHQEDNSQDMEENNVDMDDIENEGLFY